VVRTVAERWGGLDILVNNAGTSMRGEFESVDDAMWQAEIDELLALPEWVVPVAGLALGYPEAKEAMSARLSLAASVHADRYDREAVERELFRLV